MMMNPFLMNIKKLERSTLRMGNQMIYFRNLLNINYNNKGKLNMKY